MAPNGLTAKVEHQPVVTAPTNSGQMQAAGARQPLGVAPGIRLSSSLVNNQFLLTRKFF